MLSEGRCGSRRITQPVLREIFDAVEANPIDGYYELLRRSEELFVAD
jgi:hypothetical protein